MSIFSTQTILTILLLTSNSLVLSSSAQSSDTSPPCVANLIPCANYIANSTIPPQSCCGPLKTAITTQIDCLCSLYNTPGLPQYFNVTITQALDLPKRCRINGADLTDCLVGGLGPAASELAYTPWNSVTPEEDENVAGRLSGFGISWLVCIMSCFGVLHAWVGNVPY